MTNARIKQALALGAAILTLSAGGAFAATTDASVNVMAGPGSHFKTIAMLPADDSVTLAKKSGSWCDLSAPATGWNGYDWQDDANLGPAGLSSIHQMYGGSFD